jgi:pilus assembly protein CpaF
MILTLLKPGQPTPVTENLPDGNYFVGRAPSAKIVLAYPDVSERHALISINNGNATIEDLKSANGTYVNGVQIDRRTALLEDSILQIGETVLRITKEATAPKQDETVSATAQQSEIQQNNPTPSYPQESAPSKASLPTVAKTDPQATLRRKIREQIQEELIVRMDLKRLTASGIDREGLERQAHAKIDEIVAEVVKSGKLPRTIDPERIKKEVFDEALRLGPLEDLLDDPSVSEIMVNGPYQVYVERGGRLQLTDLQAAQA